MPPLHKSPPLYVLNHFDLYWSMDSSQSNKHFFYKMPLIDQLFFEFDTIFVSFQQFLVYSVELGSTWASFSLSLHVTYDDSAYRGVVLHPPQQIFKIIRPYANPRKKLSPHPPTHHFSHRNHGERTRRTRRSVHSANPSSSTKTNNLK